jgi:hypothetical protein
MDETLFESFDIDVDLAKECYEFAQLSTNNYAKRGQSDASKIKWDAFIGKMGEHAAYARLSPSFQNLSRPDMKIYEKKRKSWANDLHAGDLSFAIKSTARTSKTGLSWIFQRKDINGYGMDVEIYSPTAKDKLLVYVHVNLKRPSPQSQIEFPIKAMIKSVIPLYEMRRLELFDKPEKEDLVEYKDAVYLSALSFHGYGYRKIMPAVNDLVIRTSEYEDVYR